MDATFFRLFFIITGDAISMMASLVVSITIFWKKLIRRNEVSSGKASGWLYGSKVPQVTPNMVDKEVNLANDIDENKRMFKCLQEKIEALDLKMNKRITDLVNELHHSRTQREEDF